MKRIFPKEIIESTLEFHQFKHSTKSKIIYTIILVSLLFFFMALPLIKVTIYNNTQGIIKSDKERIIIQNITNGRVKLSNIEENKEVKQGDTLLIINNSSLKKQLIHKNKRVIELTKFIKDIKVLLKRKINPILFSEKLKQDYLFYKQKIEELHTRYKKIKDDYERNQKLFNKGVIAKITLNNSKLEYDLAKNAINQLKKQQIATWQKQLVEYEKKLELTDNELVELEENNELSIIKSPFSGTLLAVKGIEKNSYILSGTKLAELSPNSNLIVECFINPNSIGLLKKGGNVNFQVSAFNYNQWGIGKGKILDIADDIQLINNTPLFRVTCSLEKKYLQLKNGFKGHFKKGMTLNAQFIINKRSLFDLLYDKVDDWISPASQKKNK